MQVLACIMNQSAQKCKWYFEAELEMEGIGSESVSEQA